MTIIQWISIAIIAFLFSSAIYTDVRSKKIRNHFTLPLSLVGMVLLLIIHPWLYALLYTITLFLIGILGWQIGLWKAGDSKLTLSTGIWAGLALGEPVIIFALLYHLFFIVYHMVIGHFLGLKKYRFSLINYARSLKTQVNEQFGIFIGSFTILFSFLSSLYVIIGI